MDAAARHLDTLAATQIIGDAEVAACWGLVREGIQMNKLGLGNLGRLIEQLRRGGGLGLDELSIEIDPPGSARAVVGRLDEVYGCPAAALIEELERLLARAGGATSAPSPSTPPPPASPPGEGVDLLGVMAGLLGTTPAKLAGDPATYRAHAERVRAATADLATALRDPAGDDASRSAAAQRLHTLLAESAQAGGAAATHTADLPATLGALGIDLDRFTAALRTVTDWLEARTPAAGAAVDRLIAALDEAAAPLLGGDTRARRDAALEERSRDSARAAIAARLGKRDDKRES